GGSRRNAPPPSCLFVAFSRKPVRGVNSNEKRCRLSTNAKRRRRWCALTGQGLGADPNGVGPAPFEPAHRRLRLPGCRLVAKDAEYGRAATGEQRRLRAFREQPRFDRAEHAVLGEHRLLKV